MAEISIPSARFECDHLGRRDGIVPGENLGRVVLVLSIHVHGLGMAEVAPGDLDGVGGNILNGELANFKDGAEHGALQSTATSDGLFGVDRLAYLALEEVLRERK